MVGPGLLINIPLIFALQLIDRKRSKAPDLATNLIHDPGDVTTVSSAPMGEVASV